MAASNRPKDKTIVTPELRLILEWDAFFERLERRVVALEDRLGTVEGFGTPGLILLQSGIVSNQPTLDFVLTSFASYRGFKFIANLIPATDNVSLQMRFSTDGGANYDSAVNNYSRAEQFATAANTTGGAGSVTGTSIDMTGAIGNAPDEGIAIEITLLDPFNVALRTRMFYMSCAMSTAGASNTSQGSGARALAQDTDAIRFLFSSGNIASGNYAFYGLP